MKKIIFGLLLLTFQMGIAQQIAYIETEKIIEKMPEYKVVTDEIDAQIKIWEAEVEAKFKKVEDLYQDYVKNESLFPDDVKQEKQQEIFDAENLAKEYREEKFGREGELQALQNSKLKPLQDSILQTAEKIGKENNYDYIFNKTAESNWIYTNPDHNLTDLVIAELGLEN
jgi:outer membrane protein